MVSIDHGYGGKISAFVILHNQKLSQLCGDVKCVYQRILHDDASKQEDIFARITS
jgi:hypothetical protein